MSVWVEGRLEFDFGESEVIRLSDHIQGPEVDFGIIPPTATTGVLLEVKAPAETSRETRRTRVNQFIAKNFSGELYVREQFHSASLNSFRFMSTQFPQIRSYQFLGLFAVSGLKRYGFRPLLFSLEKRLRKHLRRNQTELAFISSVTLLTDLDWDMLRPQWPMRKLPD